MVAKCEEVQVGGERRRRVTDVVGEEDGLGIECLSGSGAIARYDPASCITPTKQTCYTGMFILQVHSAALCANWEPCCCACNVHSEPPVHAGPCCAVQHLYDS